MVLQVHNIDLIKLDIFIFRFKISMATIVIAYLDSQGKTRKWILNPINFIPTVLEFS